MSEPKSLGQVAYEATDAGPGEPWGLLEDWYQEEWDRVALAVFRAVKSGQYLQCRCGEPGTGPSACAYQLEINDRNESCPCCESCREECYADT